MDLLLAEYNSLRNEILANAQLVAQIFTFSVTAIVAVLGYCIKSESKKWPLLIFLPFAILIPAAMYITWQMESTIRIAAYLDVFHEHGKKDLNWENRLGQLREQENHFHKKEYDKLVISRKFFKDLKPDWQYVKSTKYTYFTLAIIIPLIAIIHMIQDKTALRYYFYLVGAVLLIFVLMIPTIRMYDKVKYPNLFTTYHDVWDQIKGVERAKDAPKAQKSLNRTGGAPNLSPLNTLKSTAVKERKKGDIVKAPG